ncbi:MAG TPA: Nramp family divalent metal transporter [Thermomicrobiaceae bacterium]|nr:Nramp family divalent metal transporter [Thermomicrobiaceae bacterium]
MTTKSRPRGIDPLAADAPSRPRTRRAISPGIRLTIRGRSVKLRGLRRPPAGVLRWLAILGPGIIAGSAGNDAGGIATYSQAGAQFGYQMLWVIVLITVSLAVVQEMSARLGAATGRGLLDLIRERFGIGWSLFAVGIVLVANGVLIISEFIGIGAAVTLLGINRDLVIPIAAVVLWYLVVRGSYGRVEKIFLLMALAFLAYPVAAILAHPQWGAVARGAVVPSFHANPTYIMLFVGLLGTTITPYQQIFQQSAVVDKGVARRHYGEERIDTYVGMFLSDLISAFMIIATAATLHVAGKTNINTAADAAQALGPVAGRFAVLLFAVGLLGASLLAGAVLPLATAFSVSEVFGFPKGVDLDFRRGKFFVSLFTVFVVVGALLAMIPGLPVIQALVWIQVLNGVLLPVILVFILLLVNDRRLMGDLRNTRLYNILGWGTVALVSTAIAIMIGTQLLGAVGIHVLGA